MLSMKTGVVALAGLAGIVLIALAALGSQGDASAATPTIQGDANCDGVVDETDAIAVLLNFLDLAEDPECASAGGDTNCNGDTEADDAIAILAYLAGLGGGVAAAGGDCTPIEGPLPSVSPQPSVTPTPTITPTPDGSQTPTATPTATPTDSATPGTGTPTATPTATPEPPEEDGYSLQQLSIGSGLPMLMSVITPVPGSPDEVIVGGQNGELVRVNLDTGVVTPFGDLTDRVTRNDALADEGLLGMTFAPGDATVIYIAYTTGVNGNYGYTEAPDRKRSRLSRFTVTGGQLDELSEDVLLDIYQPWVWHNMGQLAFGPDGTLYIASGDGGGGDFSVQQDTENLYGKILRIDVSQSGGASVSGATPYEIPPDNPDIGAPGFDEVWAYGFRHPWRFSFDTETGQMWIADVGELDVEEIDIGVAGGNFGWNIVEGLDCFFATATPTPTPTPPHCDPNAFQTPQAFYRHDQNGGGAVIGGYVYHGTRLPELDGYYIYGDFQSGRIWAIDADNPGSPPILLGRTPEQGRCTYNKGPDPTLAPHNFLTSFTQLPDGEIVALCQNNLWQIVRVP